MPSATRLSHRHQPSNSSLSSTSSSSSTRPALPQILTSSATNAVNFSRSTTPTSRRVRSHWFTHFVLNWRRSSRSSKLLLGLSMTLVGIQIISSTAILFYSWGMYCDKPLRIFVAVYIVRLILIAPINIYLHLAPRRSRLLTQSSANGNNSSLRSSAIRAELSEAYAMSERNHNTRPVSFPPPVIPLATNRNQYPPFITPIQQQQLQQQHVSTQQVTSGSFQSFDDNLVRSWIDRAKSALDLFVVFWFIIGNYMLFSSSTCSDTAQPLYYFSMVLIVYGYLILSVPVFLLGMRLLHVNDGVYMGGATEDEIAKIPVYQFKSTNSRPNSAQQMTIETTNNVKLINPTSMTLDTNPCIPDASSKFESKKSGKLNSSADAKYHITIDLSKSEHHQQKQEKRNSGFLNGLWLRLGLVEPPSKIEPEYELLEIPDVQDQICAICLSSYDDGDILCKLWCYHHFHKACLHEWLVLNVRCPMCKQDSRGKDFAALDM
ncbi:hypothetical protein BDF20DRAFT_914779 [Mycotypha africana]|uniref:uncharacterized protein n=1 Tax=Mycotypha africana TaxID=64632 RepID=UPI0023011390|nr:uncharacterized protein BDF20DRAFT_914779 [Mycotypha africana]KAI8973319.1 hypothetical protein BDF20DRAFT_914779 [Mycotypha africana]